MCGITGLVRPPGQAIDLALLRRMTERIRHRGPDDEGYLLADAASNEVLSCGGPDTDPRLALPPLPTEGVPHHLGFGFRRLAILDLSPAGHQPMATSDRRTWIVFNGEIYNYIELRRQLQTLGHAFRSGADTEVILAAYQQWGADCVTRFVGMWAFGILDLNRREVFLSRDPFGIKPLYYVSRPGEFAFASEIKSLLEDPSICRDVDVHSLLDYLNSGRSDNLDATMLAAVRQVPLAHSLAIDLDTLRVTPPRRYWKLSPARARLSFAEAAARLRELFLHNISLHLRSDVPVGTSLSGGIDSSSIVAGMRHLHPDGLDIHSFSYIADDPRISEERWVDLVGRTNAIQVHKIHITADELVADLDRLISVQDTPFGSTTIYAQFRVFQQAHEAGIKVMLDGQGVDEYLAGYAGYLTTRMQSLIRQGRWWAACRFSKALSAHPLAPLIPSHVKSPLAVPRQIIQSLRLVCSRWLMPGVGQRVRQWFGRSSAAPGGLPWMNQPWFESRRAASRDNFVFSDAELLKATLRNSVLESSLPALLRYEDRNSMAFSIESRVPYLTTEIVEFVLSLPEEYILSPDGTSKSVLRSALRGLTPDDILDRRDKIGFGTPEQSWLEKLRPWVEKQLASEAAHSIPALHLPGVVEEWQQVLAGRRSFGWHIWRWLNLIRWTELTQARYP